MADELETGSERPLRGDNTAEPVCPIKMGRDGPLCSRPLHSAPRSDKGPVCLMHSMDPNKGAGELLEAFQQEFEAILETAGEGEAQFNHFFFPSILVLTPQTILAICSFEGATFTQPAWFDFTTFKRHANERFHGVLSAELTGRD
jgi:hypothetical protein